MEESGWGDTVTTMEMVVRVCLYLWHVFTEGLPWKVVLSWRDETDLMAYMSHRRLSV